MYKINRYEKINKCVNKQPGAVVLFMMNKIIIKQ